MAELMLFRQDADGRDVELSGSTVALEVELQRRVEAGLEQMLGIRFVASEYATGPWHRGRIDTLGLDENGSPVVIEFKRGSDSGVLSQAVSYLSWLRSAQHEFEALVRKVLGAEAAESIDWRRPRMVCIAAGFSHHDRVAVQWLPERIDLVRYRVFEDGLLSLLLVDSSPGSASAASSRRSRERDAVIGSAPTTQVAPGAGGYRPRAGFLAGPVRGAGRGALGVGGGGGGAAAALHRLPAVGERRVGDLPSEARGDPGPSQTRPGLGRSGGGLHSGHALSRAGARPPCTTSRRAAQ
ncbi:endonuclease NucS domain-containing protein [Streptomyces zaomyceticus]|uniref:endonuclease NucS domain-containing protein n=1 Tax=Streptomyces zaomyceticus TaxID=68286 RepID=UPI0034243199